MYNPNNIKVLYMVAKVALNKRYVDYIFATFSSVLVDVLIILF